jgi:hypothetical protein
MVQMVPVSLNGFGIREATFSLYFTRLGLPMQSGVLVSLGATIVDDGLLAERRGRVSGTRWAAVATFLPLLSVPAV